MIISIFDRVENIVGKGEIACISNFSFSHNVFKRLLSQRRQKVSLCGTGLIVYIQAHNVVLKHLDKGKRFFTLDNHKFYHKKLELMTECGLLPPPSDGRTFRPRTFWPGGFGHGRFGHLY